MTTPRLLLVEDDPNLGEILAEFLTVKGNDVTRATDGEAGLQAWKIGKFDLCILDVMLPKKDGFDLAKICQCPVQRQYPRGPRKRDAFHDRSLTLRRSPFPVPRRSALPLLYARHPLLAADAPGHLLAGDYSAAPSDVAGDAAEPWRRFLAPFPVAACSRRR